MAGSPTRACPYCGEEILAVARKCKHCGEWLDQERSAGVFQQGSVDARAVAKGLKEEKLQENVMGCFGCLALVVCVMIGAGVAAVSGSGAAGWVVGAVFFVAAGVGLGRAYYRE